MSSATTSHRIPSPPTTAPPGHSIITEGSTSIVFGENNEVFYNPVQVLNRNLSIVVLQLFAEQRAFEAEERAAKRRARADKQAAGAAPASAEASGAGVQAAAESVEQTASTSTDPSRAALPEGGAAGDWRDWIASNGIDSGEGLHILEALSGSGLRSIRYAKEVVGIESIVVNDIEDEAVAVEERAARI